MEILKLLNWLLIVLDNPTFTYVKAPNGPLPKLDKNEVSRDRSWFDEGAYYGEKRISAFSLCN